MSDVLPHGWAMLTVDDVCDAVSKRGPNSERATFRYIDLGAIDNKSKTIVETNELRVKEAPSRAKQLVCKGDVLFSNVRVYLENIALVPDELDGEVASTAFCVLRPKEGLEPRYMYYYVTSKPFVRAVDSLQRGNSPPSVQDGDVRAQAIPVAPTSEQKCIVSKIDGLFSRIDEGERVLERVSKLVEGYRQSVLKAAVTGALTRDWREARKTSGQAVESGEALRTRILINRREAWEQAELAKMRAKGITPKDHAWKKKYSEPPMPSLGLNNLLPEERAQLSLEQATRAERPIAYGVLQPGKDAPTGIPMVRVCDVSDGVVDQSNLKRIAKNISSKFPRTLLQGREVLLTLVGTIGRTAVVPDELAGANVARAVGVLSAAPDVLPEWLELCLRSENARQVLTENAREVARKTLNLEQLREYAVPMPCSEEQCEVVSRVSELLSKADAAASAIERQIAHAGALRQSTLKSAFAGQLVSQDPNEEPASVLLNRIAAESAEPNTVAPKRGRKKKPA